MEQTLSAMQSLLIAIWVACVMSRSLGGMTLTLRFSPLMTGFICGLVMGDIKQAMIITAGLQLIYMGVFSPGGSMPQEPAIAAAIAVPVALLSKMNVESAIAIAVPVGLLGSYLYQFRFFLNTFIGKMTDKAVNEDKISDARIAHSVLTYPTIASFVLFVPLVFIALYWGAPVIADFMNRLEGTVFIHILTVVGGGLAAIGIATTIYVIGRKDLLVFFFLAYFISVVLSSLGITMVTYAIFGVMVAIIYVNARGSKDGKAVAAVSDSSSSSDAFEDGFDDGF